eukprot:TRINITY_DN1695_c0_g1_i3.p1 TRINITY_DN1695_c0_g1~~TRINITY_DN1695_c0_g1_i3.p1  ORF type:complete len:111 (+),score=40.38 TRINITY_DN1695_c0_g1_i3:34-333(+)
MPEATESDPGLGYAKALMEDDAMLEKNIEKAGRAWDSEEAAAIQSRRELEKRMQDRYEAEQEDTFTDNTVELVVLWVLVLVPMYFVSRFFLGNKGRKQA